MKKFNQIERLLHRHKGFSIAIEKPLIGIIISTILLTQRRCQAQPPYDDHQAEINGRHAADTTSLQF